MAATESSLVSQAETIRDETTTGANTATRVGTFMRELMTWLGFLGSGTDNTIPKKSGESFVDSNITDDGTLVTVGVLLTSGEDDGTDGAVTLAQRYTGGGNIALWGSMASSGSPIMAYGIKPKSGVANTFVSSTPISIPKGAVWIDGNTLKFVNAATAGVPIGTDVAVTEIFSIDASGNGTFQGGLTIESGTVGGYLDTSLGTNATALDAESVRELNVTAATYTASTTLTFSNVSNLRRFTMQITNTNANVLTFSGVTLYFKTADLPSGVTFGSNALTFPADAAVKYNLVAEKFDGSTFDCKIEIR